MGWEHRGSRRYYTRSRRVSGKVKRTYIGIGPEAELAATMDKARCSQRKATTDAQRAMIARLEELGNLTHDLDEHLRILVEAVMLAAGYHRHDRGQWQKRRGSHGIAP
jgi:hypothetical protein